MPTADLLAVPDGADVFIDSNIFVYAMSGQSAQCLALLQKISKEEITGVTSYHVVGELTHKLMLAEYLAAKGPGAGNARKYLEEHPEIVRGLTRYWAGVERVLAMNILFVPVDEAIVRTAYPIRQQNGLVNNDSLIVAFMKHLGLTWIATNDDGFLAVSGLSVFKPTDL